MNAFKSIYALLFILLLVNCKENNKANNLINTNLKISDLITIAKDQTILPKTRINKSEAAILQAKLSKNDSLLFKSYQTYGNLLYELELENLTDSIHKIKIDWTKELDSPKLAGEAYFDYASFFNDTRKIDSAFYYYNQAKNEFLKANDFEGAAKSNINISVILNDTGSYLLSENITLEAISYIKNDPNHPYLIPAYNNLAVSSGSMHNYIEELYWYDKALELTEDIYYTFSINNNKAVALTLLKRYPEAIQLLKSILRDKKIKEYPELQGRAIDNLAYARYLENPNINVEKDFQKAIKLFKDIDDYYGQSVTFDHLFEFHEKKNPKIALDYATKKYEISIITKNKESKLNALKHIIALNPSADKVKEYIKLSDSIQTEINNSKYQFAKLKFDVDANRSEIEKLLLIKTANELKLERAKFSIILGIASFIIAIIIAVSYVYYLRNKRQNEVQKTIYETEVLISQRLHDELANDLFSTITLIESIPFENVSLKDKLMYNLAHIYAQTRSISRDISNIDVEHFYDELNVMLASYRSQNTNIITKGLDAIVWDNVGNKNKIVIYRVMMELMTNMKKHSNCTLVVIKFNQDKKNIFIDYIDNGTSECSGSIKNKNGLRNVESRIKGIAGNINFDASKGFKAFLQLPIT